MAEIQNPNRGGGSDNQPLLYMMIFMVIVFAALQYYRSTKTAPLQRPALTASTSAQSQADNTGPVPQPQASVSIAQSSASAIPADVAATSETLTTVENELYRIQFSNRGAEVRSWVLKRFKDRYGAPLDLVHAQAAKQFGYPMSLSTYDPALTAGLRNALYVSTASGILRAPQTVSFHLVQGGLEVTKTFHFGENYEIHAEVSLQRGGSPVRALLAWPGGIGDQEQPQDYSSAQLETMRNGREEHTPFKKISGGNTLNAPLDFAGVADQYFAAIFLPDDPESATALTLANTTDVQKLRRDGKPAGKSVDVPLPGIAVGDVDGKTALRVFAGPKASPVLKSVHVSNSNATLEPLLDFGFFGPIAKGLYLALYWVHDHLVSNWGWAIVVLTLLINAILLPLRVQTMRSALKMQRIQPQMDAIKARYAKYKVTDPKRADMNGEIMQLQRENGVSMFGGCVPTLIQLPLLFAMLSTIPKVFELREAHWFWLHDLTAADPLHILPIFLVVSQFLVSFYMPSPGVDPAQQRMMAFMMPAFSLFITWNYASGLGLYWCVGNILMVLMQLVMNQSSLGKEMKELAAKRSRRKSGSSSALKTIQGKR